MLVKTGNVQPQRHVLDSSQIKQKSSSLFHNSKSSPNINLEILKHKKMNPIRQKGFPLHERFRMTGSTNYALLLQCISLLSPVNLLIRNIFSTFATTFWHSTGTRKITDIRGTLSNLALGSMQLISSAWLCVVATFLLILTLYF